MPDADPMKVNETKSDSLLYLQCGGAIAGKLLRREFEMKNHVLRVFAGLLLLASMSGCKSPADTTSAYTIGHSIEVRPASASTVTSLNLSYSFKSSFMSLTEGWTDAEDWATPTVTIDAEEDLYLEVHCSKTGEYES